MSVEHTPGPWRLNAGNSISIMTDTGLNVARANCGGTTGIKLTRAEANARLIAAAPDLLAACEAFLEVTRNPAPRADDRVIQWTSVSLKSAAAIAKARGQ